MWFEERLSFMSFTIHKIFFLLACLANIDFGQQMPTLNLLLQSRHGESLGSEHQSVKLQKSAKQAAAGSRWLAKVTQRHVRASVTRCSSETPNLGFAPSCMHALMMLLSVCDPTCGFRCCKAGVHLALRNAMSKRTENLFFFTPETRSFPQERIEEVQQLQHLVHFARVPPSVARTQGLHMGAFPVSISSLPISQLLPEIVAAMLSSDNLVLQAPPGAGKTTAVPLALLDEKSFGSVLVLEPRRIAARSAASRMASLLGEKLGDRIGYRVRRDGASGPQTKVLVETEGILVRRLQQDPELKGVDVVIFDEFHERSVEADLCLALCRRAQLSAQEHGGKRPKLLVMSATLGDTSALQELLGGCSAITSEGRSFPVTIKHATGSQPLPMLASSKPWEIAEAVAHEVATALAQEEGDVLAFLPGEGEIRTAERWLLKSLNSRTLEGLSIMPLFGALDLSLQRQAIEPDPDGKRRVILATPIAESSLTIEGIRVVVDSGLRKISAFDPVTGMSGLRTVPISLASATQRTGRAGRVTSGTAYRLWSERDERELTEQTPPEILQADLAQLSLDIASVGVSTPEMVSGLPWLTPPPSEALATAHDLLLSVGALRRVGDSRLEITDYAKRLARLPLHPRLSHMLLSSAGNTKLEEEASLLAALLTERDVMRGGSREHGVDIRVRLDALREATPPDKANPAIWSRAKREAAELLKELRRLTQSSDDAVGTACDDDDDTCDEDGMGLGFTAVQLTAAVAGSPKLGAGVLLALAFPDRVAQSQTGKAKSFTLSSGRTASLPTDIDSVARSEYLVAAEIDTGGRRSATIRLCAPISLTALRIALQHAIVEKDDMFVAPSDGSVRARHVVKLGSLVLQSNPLPKPTPDLAAPALLEMLRKNGLAKTLLRPTDDQGQAARELISRVALLRALHGKEVDWPAWSEESLLADAELWLDPVLQQATSLKEIQKSDIAGMLSKLLDGGQLAMLEKQAPKSVKLPSGSIGHLRYAPADGGVLPERDSDCEGAPPIKPVLGSKLQEWFGATAGPTVGGPPGETLGVQLNLLSPSLKAPTPLAMVSGSLAEFWNGAYQEVRKAGKSRYPKHPWPEDPMSATPTRLSKKALERQGADSAGSGASGSTDRSGNSNKRKSKKRKKR